MQKLSGFIRYDKEFSEALSTFRHRIKANEPLPLIINGLTSGASDAFLSEFLSETEALTVSPALIFVSSDRERERVCASLISSGIKALQYKPRDLVFYNISASHDTERERLSVLSSIMRGDCSAVVTTPSAAILATMPEELLLSLGISVKCGEEYSPLLLTTRLSELGFAAVDMVENAGQFAHRGGIVDIWSDAECNPVRVEFFGDEVDRIAYFDPETQRAVENISDFSILPASEVLLDKKAKERILSAIQTLIKKNPAEEILLKLKSEMSALESGLHINFRDKYLGLTYDGLTTLLSYFSTYKRIPVFVFDTNGVREELDSSLKRLADSRAALLSLGLVTERAAVYSAGQSDFNRFLEENLTLHINSFSSGLGSLKASGLFGFRCRRTVSYGDNPRMLLEDLSGFSKALYRTLLVCENKQSAEALVSSLASSDISAVPIYNSPDFNFDSLPQGGIAVTVGRLREGYELITPKIALLSMARDEGKAIMANRRRQRILRKAGGAGRRLMSYADLSVGDYVVHANYGIGLFEGMQSVKVDGITKDYITIRYAGTDKLFVPCDRLEYIGKYIGERDKDGKVKLSKMGGGDWNRVKSKAKVAAHDIAKDLINLYAERQRKEGFAFPADSELDDEFAASFDYIETESQIIAIEEIKKDMMKPVPMNRLLCGDVGFGKTEVALRAAFKAIMGGKQVAILVPTTILAMQHLETATSRMRGYPITIEMLSRFRTPKQQESILRRVKRGEIDILIGTHKLLSKSLEFRDLGLLIVDEEQRFGVVQKEKLKEMARNVDVLTLSATPIPRTLNMAMNGISDMSILDEAPGERRPVQTYVLEHDDGVIFDAIVKELSRGGQVLYLYNRIEDIEFAADKIIRALPDARVAVAHGKMDKDELEDIWQMLVKAEIDVLVCTTIIETGIDLPNANTLIIENADRMGLSQLHQIRGRVGRSSRQAYAYFTYRPGKALSEIASKRLAAIREFAEFGAGFKVALRDLEIRGAGNLLGAEQHGYIDSVGYDLYVKLLSEAVLLESGRAADAPFESAVDIRVSANIPDKYIPVSAQRMEMYKKISLISEPCDMQDVTDEFVDRFGDMPIEVERLVTISLIRALASKARVRRVELRDGALNLQTEKPELSVWSELFAKHSGLALRAGTVPCVIYKLKSGEDGIKKAAAILTDYYELITDNKGDKE